MHPEVAKGVHRIDDAYVNWFLIEDAGSITVVDCGVRNSWRSFIDALPRIGRSTRDVKAIVLTHAHFDHTGFAERARAELGIEVWVHENDVPLTHHPFHYSHLRSRIPYLANPGALPIAGSLVRNGALWPKAIEEVRRFTDGALEVPGSPRVVFTPGHTLGHCAFHLADRDAVIVGDALVNLDPYTGKVGPRMVARAATADLERAIRSLDAISETGATIVLPGHGDPWTEGAESAARLAAEAGAA